MATGWSRNSSDVTTPKFPPPQRPGQVGVRVGARCDELPIGRDYVCFQQIVDGQAALSRQVAEPAAEQQQKRHKGGNEGAEADHDGSYAKK
jgi:hypothetical protein